MGPDQSQPRPVRILLVEDDPLLQEIFGSTLASQGYEVETSSDGLNALWKVREGRYDLVLCDYKLPEINGLAMARLIRDLVNTAARPALIALTGAPASLMDKEALPGRAFDEIVAKPVNLDRLVSIVQRHLDARAGVATRQDAGFGGFGESQAGYDAYPGAARQEGHPSSPCILVIEDDEVQRSVLQSVLEASGYAVKVAVDGFHAVRMLRGGAFDLALVDYQLPEMDGLATGRLILNLAQGARPRMIAFTSAPSQLAGRLAGIDEAFDEVVAKSDGLPALLAAVERHLRLSPKAEARRAAEVAFPSAA